MRAAFDTSVVVAGRLEAHAHHRRARVWLRAVVDADIEAFVSRHALAETWAVLTRLPMTPRLSSIEALRVVERLLEDGFVPIDMTADVYDAALRRCADAGLSSGAVFDALHLAAAESVGADLMLTFNVKHFRPLVREGSPTILAPPEPPSLEIVRSP